MYGRLEKYTTKFDPLVKALINKCLENDENKRLDAKAMLEYQNQLEYEAYGEVRSIVMLDKIKTEYDAIMLDTMVHQNLIEYSKSIGYYNQGLERYKNPHFFMN
jgi:hypothetical protein